MTTNANMIQTGGDYVREELLTAETITPGHLCERYNASGTQKVRKHSTAKGWAERMFAVEDALQGRTIDDNYASGELVSLNVAKPGSKIQAILYPGTAYVIGDKLMSKGDGSLQKISGTADLDVVAILDEACDLSASGAVATRADVTVR